jgi:hypothetical protein
MKPPVALQPVTLLALVRCIMEHHDQPSTLVVCSSRDEFLQDMLSSVQDASEDEDQYHLSQPILHLLRASSRMNVAFCPSLQTLHAWLSWHSHSSSKGSKSNGKRSSSSLDGYTDSSLIVVNPIALHRSTSSFSAQGLSRTFAGLIDLSICSRQRLIIAECVPTIQNPDQRPQSSSTADSDEGERTIAANTSDNDVDTTPNPWDQDISILNVTTKSFGVGERGWVGRTVKIGQVIQRWCEFKPLHVVFGSAESTGSMYA